MWTLNLCLGSEYFDSSMREVWLRIYCSMLKILVTAALEEERLLASGSGKSTASSF
jgi:hypothetical protein